MSSNEVANGMANEVTEYRIGDIVFIKSHDTCDIEEHKKFSFEIRKLDPLIWDEHFSVIGKVLNIIWPKESKQDEFTSLMQSFLKKKGVTTIKKEVKYTISFLTTNKNLITAKNEIIEFKNEYFSNNLKLIARKIT
jgi:hypothetical protein